MPTIDPTTLTPDDLEPMLQAWACGTHAGEAAVGLLIRHRSWLHRRDFLRTAVDAIDDGWGPLGCIVPMAAVQWDVIEDFQREAPGSSSELAILRLAASLAGTTVRAPLSELTGGLDDLNARLVLDALAHRFGWHASGRIHTVTGHQYRPTTRAAGDLDRQPLPTFEDIRAQADKLLGDATDWLRSDPRRDSRPVGAATVAVHDVVEAIGAAKAALDRAAHAQTTSVTQRHHAGAGHA